MSKQTTPLPCPFCGRAPRVTRGKKGHCQLHGEPFQAVRVACETSDCVANPAIEGGDIYNGGEPQARAQAVARWNTRAA